MNIMGYKYTIIKIYTNNRILKYSHNLPHLNVLNIPKSDNLKRKKHVENMNTKHVENMNE